LGGKAISRFILIENQRILRSFSANSAGIFHNKYSMEDYELFMTNNLVKKAVIR